MKKQENTLKIFHHFAFIFYRILVLYISKSQLGKNLEQFFHDKHFYIKFKIFQTDSPILTQCSLQSSFSAIPFSMEISWFSMTVCVELEP